MGFLSKVKSRLGSSSEIHAPEVEDPAERFGRPPEDISVLGPAWNEDDPIDYEPQADSAVPSEAIQNLGRMTRDMFAATPEPPENFKALDPVDPRLKKPSGIMEIGNTDLETSAKESRWLSAMLPYSNVINAETARRKDGTVVRDKNGELLKKVVIRVPMKVELDGYTLGGLKFETVRPKSRFEAEEECGEMRVAFRPDRNLKLWAKRHGERVEVTIGCDKLSQFAESLDKEGKVLIDCVHSFDEVSLDELMDDKNKEAAAGANETVPVEAYGICER